MKEEARGDGDGTHSKVLTRGVLTRRKGEKIRRLGREAVRSEIVPIATKRLVQFDEWHDELRASVRRKGMCVSMKLYVYEFDSKNQEVSSDW